MRKLAAEGASVRGIASTLGVAPATVTRWLAADAHGSGPRASKRSARARQASAGQAPAAVVSLLEEVDAHAPLEVIRRRRLQIARALDDNFDATTTGAFPMGVFERLAKLETFYLGEEARHTPPEPPDPEKDPHNIEATRRVEAQLRNLIEDAEENARCLHCGRPPFTHETNKKEN